MIWLEPLENTTHLNAHDFQSPVYYEAIREIINLYLEQDGEFELTICN